MTTGFQHSVQVRLVRHAKELGIDPNVTLVRYASERLLYRLSRSPHAGRFVLKGALLLLVWLGETIRPTRDVDLLGFGALDVDSLRTLFAEICAQPVEPDGIEFDTASLRVGPIRIEDAYGGQRVELTARLGKARLRVQVDVGIGDAVVPEPRWIEYPSLLDLPRPRLRAYRPETAVAEKLHAMVALGAANSRMRDFFDVNGLSSGQPFDGGLLAEAIAATFARRRTEVPRELPIALTREFAAIPGKAAQWAGFTRRLVGGTTPPELEVAIDAIARFAGPPLLAVGRSERFDGSWAPGGPWR
ncbi:MAG: nucleotidyl transferase AbiEii/AbiGii toxin family protein [Candidatus Eisenbacteria bacterium]|uniref:Nucleotidyl transferase AbiEii/AbiGii toxin family protein n=1 Tax=Eiseniibacteriota bacterium TaxID=2212470 RepID=A0A937XAQ3_UNCEI|nr:nucleotidyl transferase AbiEii/AbiGii toxin family protein [Candidatus Eisenbacteria bacterium]